jgi:transcriptional regulator with XRE-family HTH domain
MIGDQVSESPPVPFGGLLRSLRMAAGLTQEELAEAAKVSYRTISDVERGISRSPRRDTTRLLADALGLSGDDRAGFEAAARGHASAAGHVAPQPLPGSIAATWTLPRDIASFPGREPEIESLQAATDTGGGGDVVGIWATRASQMFTGLPTAAGLPRSAGSRVWGDVPARNPGFTGREGLLAAVREALVSWDRALVVALHGMGGVGKTQLAAEYAHRHAGEYGVVWWVAAEQPALIGEQFAGLAVEMGCAAPGTPVGVARRAVLGALHGRGGWLLVFDDAERPEDVARWLPGGPGHVLITSRVSGWSEAAVQLEVDVLDRPESVAMLRARVPGLDDAAAGRVARALGDLPLAVAQAAGYMDGTGMLAGEYLEVLASRAGQVLGLGRPASYPRSLAAVTQLALDRLRGQAQAAAELAGACAFLAPEPVPSEWFTSTSAVLPGPLGEAAADPLAWRQALGSLAGSALARLSGAGLQMHRLTQAITRGYLSPEEAAVSRTCAEAVLAATSPGDPGAPRDWPRWARLLPHLQALDPGATGNPALRALACQAAWYLLRRGDARGGHDLAASLHQNWRERLGPDDRDTLRAAQPFARALWQMGRYHQALELDEDTLARCRGVLGEDHPDTLHCAHGLAGSLWSLGNYRAALELDKDTLARRRQVLGEDHPDTLHSAHGLAIGLWSLGGRTAARELEQDVLARRRRVLGEDHPDTLNSASNLAADLRGLGERGAARELDEDTLARRRRVLGEDHPDTLHSAHGLAADLRGLGEYGAARELDEDTLARRRRVLGEDHPDTRRSAHNLAAHQGA